MLAKSDAHISSAGNLKVLAARIRRRHKELANDLRRNLATAIAIGADLNIARARCKHGKWGEFLHSCALSWSTAWVYQGLAERADEIRAATSIRDAQRKLKLGPEVELEANQPVETFCNVCGDLPAAPDGPSYAYDGRCYDCDRKHREREVPAEEPPVHTVKITPVAEAIIRTGVGHMRPAAPPIVDPEPPVVQVERFDLIGALADLDSLAEKIAGHDIKTLCDVLTRMLERFNRRRAQPDTVIETKGRIIH
jgi:hypothetical protein